MYNVIHVQVVPLEGLGYSYYVLMSKPMTSSGKFIYNFISLYPFIELSHSRQFILYLLYCFECPGAARNAIGVVSAEEDNDVWVLLPSSRNLIITLEGVTHNSQDQTSSLFAKKLKQYEVFAKACYKKTVKIH